MADFDRVAMLSGIDRAFERGLEVVFEEAVRQQKHGGGADVAEGLKRAWDVRSRMVTAAKEILGADGIPSS